MVSGWRKVGVVCCLLLLVLLTACGDYRPIEASFNVVAIAIDMAKSDDTAYTVTVIGVDYPKTKLTLSADGSSVMDAMNAIQNKTSKQVILSHVETILFARKVAEAGLNPVLDVFFRNMQIRSDATALVVAGQAGDYLKHSKIKTSITGRTYPYQMRTGTLQFDPHLVNMHALLISASAERGNYVLPYFRLHKKQKLVAFSGFAICKHGRMIVRLSMKETNAFLILRRAITKQLLTLVKIDTTLQFTYHKPKVTANWRGGRVRVHYVIRMKDQLVEQAPFRVKPINNTKARAIQDQAESQLKKQCVKLVKKMQDLECDPFGLAETVRVANPKAFQAKKWDRTFADAKVTFQFELKVERFGQMF